MKSLKPVGRDQVIGVVGIVLMVIFFFSIEVGATSPPILHYKAMWLSWALLAMWLVASIGYKVILIVGLNHTRFSVVGFVAVVLFTILVLSFLKNPASCARVARLILSRA